MMIRNYINEEQTVDLPYFTYVIVRLLYVLYSPVFKNYLR